MNHNTRNAGRLAGLAAAAAVCIFVALMLVDDPDPADAHTGGAAARCGGVTVDVTDYEPGTTYTVTINGTTTTARGSSLKAEYPADTTKPMTWRVVIDNKGDGMGRDQWDRTFSGTEPACATASTTTSSSTTTTVTAPPTTSAPVVDPPVVLIPPLVETRAAPPVVVAPALAVNLTPRFAG